MSKQIYWCAINTRTWGKKKLWPSVFYKTHHEADMYAWEKNKYWPKQKWIVKRVLFETKDAIHYDIYQHEFKRI